MTEIERAKSPEEIMFRTAERIAQTSFAPDAFRGRPNEVFAAILYGRELGWGPMRSLHSLNVIKGKVTMAPEAMRALVFAAGHTITTVTHTDTEVVLVGKRGDTDETARVGWTLDDARRAGLVKTGGAWTSYPRAMLLARATSELCRLLFPDVLVGASYTPDEADEAERPLRVEVVETVEAPARTVGEHTDGVEQAVLVGPDDLGDGAVAVAGDAHESPALDVDGLRARVRGMAQGLPTRLVAEARQHHRLPLIADATVDDLREWYGILVELGEMAG